MARQIKTIRSWQKHLPKRPHKVRRSYYSDQKKSNSKIIVRIIWAIFIILAMQSIFQANYFKVDKITVKDNQDLSAEEIILSLEEPLNANRFFIFKNNNYFLLKTKPLEAFLVDKYNLDSAKVDKKFPDQLAIWLKEKISYFIWQKDGALYLLDAKGGLNRQIEASDEKYLILDDKRAYRPSEDQIFTNDEVNIINNIYLGWNDKINSKFKLKRVLINDTWDLELYTDIGFYVKLDINEDINTQLDNLKKVLDENITGLDINYIDVRFGDKVYFK